MITFEKGVQVRLMSQGWTIDCNSVLESALYMTEFSALHTVSDTHYIME